MKAKKINKKLSLSKKTIADFDNLEKNRIYGGFEKTREAECFSYGTTQCAYSWCMSICGGPLC
jgi:hypothetical protein